MKIYLVGGAVRDELLGKKPKDFDFLVVGATEKEFLKRYPNAKKVGKSFPVFLIGKNEYAFARKEKKIAKGYRGFEMKFSPEITLKEDLLRRDFTINAIVKDLETNEIIDLIGGVKDLKNKRLIHITKAFKEDPLRVYRGASLMARLGDFSIAKSTLNLMKSLKPELNTLSKERVWIETLKGLNGEIPSKFFTTLKEAEVLEIHFDFLLKLSETDFQKTMQFIDFLKNEPVFSFASLFLFLQTTLQESKIIFKKLSPPSKFVKFAKFLIKYKEIILSKNFQDVENSVQFLTELLSFELKNSPEKLKYFFNAFVLSEIFTKSDFLFLEKAFFKIKDCKLPEDKKNLGKKSADFLKEIRMETYLNCLRNR